MAPRGPHTDCSKTHIQKSGRRNRCENVRYPHAAHSVRKTYVFVRLAGDVLWIRQGCTLQSPRKVVYPMRSDSIFVGPLAKSNEFHKPMLQPCSSLEQGWSIANSAVEVLPQPKARLEHGQALAVEMQARGDSFPGVLKLRGRFWGCALARRQVSTVRAHAPA